MKSLFSFVTLVVLARAAPTPSASGSALVQRNEDRTITKVVKLLQDMLAKSQAEGDEERTIYAKFKCYCDQSEAEKKASIKSLTEQISLLESKIEEIQGSSGELSSDCADLKAKMADAEAAMEEATSIRDKQNKAFLAEEADLTEAISALKEAIETLAEVGADQTASSGAADHKKFMAGFGEKKEKSLLSVQAQIKDALDAASALMNTKQRKSVAAFVQAPFTGTYTSQSAEVMGILKEMRDTFSTNLATAVATEKEEKEAYDKYMTVKKEAFKEMEADYEKKQKELGDNDGELASKKSQLAEAEKQKASDEGFLAKLLPMCAEKAKGYEERKLARANEEAAISEAVSILNSDAAFATFGTVDATSKGKTGAAFVQLRSVQRHGSSDMRARNVIKSILQKAVQQSKSARIAKVMADLQADNPFDTVLVEIEKMIKLIAEEAEADKKNLEWCNKERDENEASLSEKETEILSLKETIDKLDTTINDPETGLKKQLADTETSLIENKQSQTSETKERTEANLAYQADIKNLVDAEQLLTKAIKVLKAYYDELSAKLAASLKLMQEDPNAPEAWKGDSEFAGQSQQGGDVINMLEYILSESKKEETTAHTEEEKSQADYEDSMTQLKKEEADAEKSLANLHATLAEKEKELLEAREDLKSTTKDKEAIETYLAKIKPGCDFITTNYQLREDNRATEKAALEKAVKLIKETPAYKTSVNEATVESYGKCKEPCVADAEDVKCKACMADVTIPAYCAGRWQNRHGRQWHRMRER
jgi:DNA repair exonuclease SbcCD ATPase subunit